MIELSITATNLELPKGARFTYRARYPIRTDALYLLTIDQLLTVGRYRRDATGRECIVQPGRLTWVSDEFDVEIWGEVVPLALPSGFDRIASPSLLFAGAAIIEICDLVAPVIL